MLKIEQIKKLMECIVLTGYLKDEKPVSLFLIGRPETGKSSLIQILMGYPNTTFHNELSFKGLIDELLPKLERNEISHILIPDFINIISHKKTSESLIPALNSLMEEGIKDLKYYGSSRTFSKAINGGLITGMTREMFDKRVSFWRNIGFLTRMLFITYGYNELTKIQIHQFIKGGGYKEIEKITKDFSMYKLSSFDIEVNEEMSNKIELIVKTIVSQTSSYVVWMDGDKRTINLERYGFRLHRQLRTLAKAIALYNDRKEVTEEDINELINLTSFMNFNFTEL